MLSQCDSKDVVNRAEIRVTHFTDPSTDTSNCNSVADNERHLLLISDKIRRAIFSQIVPHSSSHNVRDIFPSLISTLNSLIPNSN